MKRFAFVSSHEPLNFQNELAKEKGIELEHIELSSVDLDTLTVEDVIACMGLPPSTAGARRIDSWDGVVTGDPKLAELVLRAGFPVGKFDKGLNVTQPAYPCADATRTAICNAREKAARQADIQSERGLGV